MKTLAELNTPSPWRRRIAKMLDAAVKKGDHVIGVRKDGTWVKRTETGVEPLSDAELRSVRK